MIKLVVADYCQNCEDFDPVVKTSKASVLGFDAPTPYVSDTVLETVIRCKYCKRCENIKRYLEKENKKNGKTD